MQDWCCCHQATALWLGLEPIRTLTEAVLQQEAGQLLLWLSGSSSGVVEMAANFTCSFTALCCLALWSFTRTSGTLVTPPHSTIRPGFPVPVNTNNPEVRKAARFGVYRYNNSSNDLFLFKESQIKKAMVQIVRGLKYMLHVEIKHTVYEKRDHPSLDSCHFQREKNLQQMLRCYFEVWITPWTHKVHIPVAQCHQALSP
ncbi:cystatin-F-like isoform X2 [Passer domesticus]|uniref:cystatin-F-like isoform X2 n=1 Tax=Passer domesticus TaxID=48849 RepID=UPI0030FE3F39